MTKKTILEIYKKNEIKNKKEKGLLKKKLMMGSKSFKPVKLPKVSIPLAKPSNSPVLANYEIRMAKMFLKDFLKFDAKKNIEFYEVFNKKNCLEKSVCFDLVDHYKMPKKVKIENKLRIITTILLHHKKTNIYFWLKSSLSSFAFDKGIFQFFVIVPPEELTLTIKDFEEGLADLADFQIIDILKEDKFKEFFE